MYYQSYNPTGNAFLSTLVAAIPIVVLLYFIALHPSRDRDGVRHLGIAAPYAALYGVIAAFLVSCLAFKMPVAADIGLCVGIPVGVPQDHLDLIWPLCFSAMTVVTGKFEIVKESIVHISFDRRLHVC
jgi:lactate permease